MLDLMCQSTKSTVEQVKEYLKIIELHKEAPVFYKKGFSFNIAEDDYQNGCFKSTHKALASELKGNEYFAVEVLDNFKALDEHDIFAHKRGYYYAAQHSVGRFTTGEYVIGLTEDRAEFLLSKGSIEKVYIKDVEARESKTVQALNKQIEYLESRLANKRDLEVEKPLIELGSNQKLLAKYDLFTPKQIACLLANQNPACIESNNDYLAYSDWVTNALEAKRLVFANDKGQVSSEQVKSWLARNDFIYEGFNDDLIDYLNDEDDPLERRDSRFTDLIFDAYDVSNRKDEELEELAADYEELRLKNESLEDKVKELTKEFGQHTLVPKLKLSKEWEEESKKYQDEIMCLKEQISEQAKNRDNDDKELNPKTQRTVKHLLNVLFHKAQLDITAHRGATNTTIVRLSESLNSKITEKPVGYWIQQVQQLRIDNKEKQ